ncbi:tyrosine-type recombinase/integrase [Cerasicoccus fimbriatus]|uniref:tyrosine-type recombinase/integrase n=1 Tax=Cerasicoccus fimbriatus TaxID=3014554 RepID=UPI003CCDF10A
MIHQVHERTKNVNGKKTKSRFYYLRYRYGDMEVERLKSLGVTQKEVADKLAVDFRNEWEAEQAGMLPPVAMREGAKLPLLSHLEDFLADLRKRGKAGRKDEGAKKYQKRITQLLNECHWKVISNVTPDSFIAWRNHQHDLAPRTLNHFQDAMNAFLNTLVKFGRIPSNPLASVSKVKQRGKEVRKRRAFSEKELAVLLSAAQPHRSMVYFTAARTGFRRQELAALLWQDVVLDGMQPHIRARASTTKNEKEGLIPLVPDLQEALSRFKPANAKPTEKVFKRGIPRARDLAQDLERVGIPYQDEQGRYADFHSFRYTWGTFLQANGATQREAMELMRHNDVRLTAQIYTDVNHLPLFDRVRSLPRLEKCALIGSQISGKPSNSLIKRDKKSHIPQSAQAVDFEPTCNVLTNGDTPCWMVPPRGLEPRTN